MKKNYFFLLFAGLLGQQLNAQELSADEIEFAKTGYLQTQVQTKQHKTIAPAAFQTKNAFVSGCDSLETIYTAGNGQSGVMFDVIALQPLTIEYIYSNLSAITSDVKLYFKTGTYDTFSGDSTAWTLLGTANVSVPTTNVPVFIPIPINLSMNTGDTLAFYLTRVGTTTAAGTVRYTNGTTVNSLYASDSALAFYEGIGVVYPFGNTYSPRVWNGTIKYCTGPVGVNSLSAAEYEVKSFYNAATQQLIVEIPESSEFENASLELNLIDMLGKSLSSEKLNKGKNVLPVQNLPKGIYIANITKGSTLMKQTKVVIYE